jgi:hypothetical protein
MNPEQLEDFHSRFTDDEMKAVMIDVVAHCYDFLMGLCSPHGQESIGRTERERFGLLK